MRRASHYKIDKREAEVGDRVMVMRYAHVTSNPPVAYGTIKEIQDDGSDAVVRIEIESPADGDKEVITGGRDCDWHLADEVPFEQQLKAIHMAPVRPLKNPDVEDED